MKPALFFFMGVIVTLVFIRCFFTFLIWKQEKPGENVQVYGNGNIMYDGDKKEFTFTRNERASIFHQIIQTLER